MVKNLVLFDMDGTLCDPSHRLKKNTKGKMDWKAFNDFELVMNAPPKQGVLDMFKLLKPTNQFKLLVVTARMERFRKVTLDWLDRHSLFVLSKDLLMRADDDCRPDYEVKKDMLETLGKDQVKWIFDDRDSVVEMWRDEGLTCFQVDKFSEL